MKRTLTVLTTLALATLVIAAPAALSSAATSPSPAPQHRTGELLGVKADLPFTATVIEAFDSDSYTYALVEDEDGQRWLAAPYTDLKAGMVVRHGDGTLVRDFYANGLNRTFAGVFFIGAMQAE
jgi:hypothetical protein